MGCDWSKTAGSVDDLRDAPYSLLSVAVEEGKMPVVKVNKNRMANSSSSAKKREKRKGSGDRDGTLAPVPVSSTSEQDNKVGSAKLGQLGLNLPKGINAGDAMDKENQKQSISGADGNTGLRQKLQLDISKTKEVPREPTERQLRTEKLARYERECTKIEDYMYVGGILVAQNKELLVGVGITHIVNCSAITTGNYFPDTFKYKALWINDAPGEDLSCHIYEIVRFIDEVRRSGGKVLVHCTQGVSRSCSFCIAYTMIDKNINYDEAFNYLKARRGICNPNAGFCSQLVKWGRRVLENAKNRGMPSTNLYQPRIYRVAYYYSEKKSAGVAPIAEEQKSQVFSPESAYVLETKQQIFIWLGAECQNVHIECSSMAVKDLQKYEGAPTEVKLIKQGQEPAAFLQEMKELNCSVPGGSVLDAPAEKRQEEPPAGHNGAEPESSSRKAFPQGGIGCEVQTPRQLPKLNLGGSSKETDQIESRAHKSPVVEEDDAEGELGKMRMFEIPSWEELTNFDSDDLWSTKAFVLIERSLDAVPVHVWIGEEYDAIDNVNDEDECLSFAKDSARDFARVSKPCFPAHPIPCPACLSVYANSLNQHSHTSKHWQATGIAIEEVHAIAEGREPDDFWDLFELG